MDSGRKLYSKLSDRNRTYGDLLRRLWNQQARGFPKMFAPVMVLGTFAGSGDMIAQYD